MSERLTKWEGSREDGTRKAVLAKRDAPFADLLIPALNKLAAYEDAEERGYLRLPSATEAGMAEKIKYYEMIHQMEQAEIVRLRRMVESLAEQVLL